MIADPPLPAMAALSGSSGKQPINFPNVSALLRIATARALLTGACKRSVSSREGMHLPGGTTTHKANRADAIGVRAID